MWRALWLSGQVTESEFRRLRDEDDTGGAEQALRDALPGGDLDEVSRRWLGASIACLERSLLSPRLRRAMSGSYLTIAGATAVLGFPSVAIVGTRVLPPRTAARLSALVDGIVRVGVSVVSGGAYGVDTMCHEASLRHSVPATIVIAGGLHHPSPAGSRAAFERIVREGGAVVTDRPPTCRPHRRDFVRRNALIAAIADVVVVAAAPDKSGALETARVARRLGVPVLAVPGMFDDPSFAGAHQLLRDGAGLCTEPDDVARALGAQPNLAFAPQARGPSVSPPAAHLLALLRDGQTVDELVRAGQFTLAEAHELLLELELEGVLAG